MSIEEAQQQIIEEFSFFEDWADRYQRIIEIGEAAPPLDLRYKTEKNRVPGCQSKVWLHTELREGKIYYQADSDAAITKGLVALLVKVLSGHPPAEIVAAKLDFIDKVGLAKHLSPTRSNGLANMVKKMKQEALMLAEQEMLKANA